VLDGGRLTLRSCRFTPGNNPVPCAYESGWPHDLSGRTDINRDFKNWSHGVINTEIVMEIVWKILDSRTANCELLLQFEAGKQMYVCTVALLSYRTVYIRSLRNATLCSSDNIYIYLCNLVSVIMLL